MTSDIFFDNFFITNDRNTAERWAADGWGLKKAAEGAAEVSHSVTSLTEVVYVTLHQSPRRRSRCSVFTSLDCSITDDQLGRIKFIDHVVVVVVVYSRVWLLRC